MTTFFTHKPTAADLVVARPDLQGVGVALDVEALAVMSA